MRNGVKKMVLFCKKRIVIICVSLLILLSVITVIIRVSNPLLAAVLFSTKTNYQVTYAWGSESRIRTAGKKEVMNLFVGKKIVRDDSLKEIGNENGSSVYFIPVRGEEYIVYYDGGPDNAVVFHQGKWYQITNPEYPIGF